MVIAIAISRQLAQLPADSRRRAIPAAALLLGVCLYLEVVAVSWISRLSDAELALLHEQPDLFGVQGFGTQETEERTMATYLVPRTPYPEMRAAQSYDYLTATKTLRTMYHHTI
jgi:hypothetical protein